MTQWIENNLQQKCELRVAKIMVGQAATSVAMFSYKSGKIKVATIMADRDAHPLLFSPMAKKVAGREGLEASVAMFSHTFKIN